MPCSRRASPITRPPAADPPGPTQRGPIQRGPTQHVLGRHGDSVSAGRDRLAASCRAGASPENTSALRRRRRRSRQIRPVLAGSAWSGASVMVVVNARPATTVTPVTASHGTAPLKPGELNPSAVSTRNGARLRAEAPQADARGQPAKQERDAAAQHHRVRIVAGVGRAADHQPHHSRADRQADEGDDPRAAPTSAPRGSYSSTGASPIAFAAALTFARRFCSCLTATARNCAVTAWHRPGQSGEQAFRGREFAGVHRPGRAGEQAVIDRDAGGLDPLHRLAGGCRWGGAAGPSGGGPAR